MHPRLRIGFAFLLSGIAAAGATQGNLHKTFAQASASLLHQGSVQGDLGLTNSQIASLAKVSNEMSYATRLRGNKMAQMSEEGVSIKDRVRIANEMQGHEVRMFANESLAVLNPKQRTRLMQLALRRSPASALAYPDVQASLGIESKQAARIAKMSDDYRRAWIKLDQATFRAHLNRLGQSDIDLGRLASSERTEVKALETTRLTLSGDAGKDANRRYHALMAKARGYQPLSMEEMQRRMTDPSFKASMEAARASAEAKKQQLRRDFTAKCLAVLTATQRSRLRILQGEARK